MFVGDENIIDFFKFRMFLNGVHTRVGQNANIFEFEEEATVAEFGDFHAYILANMNRK